MVMEMGRTKNIIEVIMILTIVSAYTLVALDIIIYAGDRAQEAKDQIYGKRADLKTSTIPETSTLEYVDVDIGLCADIDSGDFKTSTGTDDPYTYLGENTTTKYLEVTNLAGGPEARSETYEFNWSTDIGDIFFVTWLWEVRWILQPYGGNWLTMNVSFYVNGEWKFNYWRNQTTSQGADELVKGSWTDVINGTMIENITVVVDSEYNVDANGRLFYIDLGVTGIKALIDNITVTETITVTEEETKRKKVYIDPTLEAVLEAYGIYIGMIIAGIGIGGVQMGKRLKKKKTKSTKPSILKRIF
jgi:hypothetical protein